MTNVNKIIAAWFALCDTHGLENVRTMREVKGTRANHLSRAIQFYWRSREFAQTRTNLVGVGVVTYADYRLSRFLERSGISL
jgi:hypothetical protein